MSGTARHRGAPPFEQAVLKGLLYLVVAVAVSMLYGDLRFGLWLGGWALVGAMFWWWRDRHKERRTASGNG